MLYIVVWLLLEILGFPNITILFRRPPMRRAKNTKKENQCLSGQLITSVFFRIELGTYHKSSLRYFLLYLNRFKISGPDGSHYWASHETHVAGSDADDV